MEEHNTEAESAGQRIQDSSRTGKKPVRRVWIAAAILTLIVLTAAGITARLYFYPELKIRRPAYAAGVSAMENGDYREAIRQFRICGMDYKDAEELTGRCAEQQMEADLERIGDYAARIAHTTNQMQEKNIHLSEEAMRDLNAVIEAERDIVNSTIRAYQEQDLDMSMKIKPYSAGIRTLCEILNARHIGRLSRGECDMQQGAVYGEILNAFERIASHCVAISGMVRRAYQNNPDYHVHSKKARELTDEEYQQLYNQFLEKYDMIKNAERPLSLEDETVS